MKAMLMTLSVLALTSGLCVAETDDRQWRANEDATATRSLEDVLHDCDRELEKHEKTQFASLITTEQIRSAFDDALLHAEFGLTHDPNVPTADVASLREDIAPIVK